MAALADAGVTMRDMGVLAAGNLMNAGAGHRPAAAEADRPDRHPRLQRGQRLRHRRHRAAHGDHGGQGRRVSTSAWPSASRSWPAPACSARRAAARPTATRGRRTGRYGAVAPVDGRIGTETMPGVFAQIGMEYGHRYGGTSFELFARISEKNHAHSTLNPLAAYPKRIQLERDHERRDDRLPQHPADVLGQLRRRGRRGRRQRREAEDAVGRAAAAGGEGVGVGADDRPVGGGVPGPAQRQHAHPQRRRARPTSRPASAPRTSTWSSCTTASPPPSWSTTTT